VATNTAQTRPDSKAEVARDCSGNVYRWKDRFLRFRKPTLLAVAMVLVLMLQLEFSIRHQSQTIDEGFHLVSGYRYWQCRDFGINSEHPPLVKFVAAAPLWFGHAPAPDGDCGREPTDKGYGYGLAVDYLYGGDLDADKLLFRARLAASFFALVLAASCFFLAKSLFGDVAGWIALLLLIFEPNVLAHGALITTDTAVSAFMLLAVFAFFRYHQTRAAGWLIATGFGTGLAFASKHSGVLLIPILVMLAAMEMGFGRFRFSFLKDSEPDMTPLQTGHAPSLLRVFAELALILLIGVVVLWSFYGWRFAARSGGQPMDASVTEFVGDVQEEGTGGIVLTGIIPFLAHWHLLPEAYLHGMVDVISVSDPGQPPYLLEKLYPHGRWFYFPVAFFIKSTLAFIALLAIVFFTAGWRDPERRRKSLYLIIPPAILFLVAMQSGLDIGYRHVLPIVGFLCVLMGGSAASLLSRRPIWRTIIILLLVAHVASSLLAYPNYLPYSNELWGGPSKTYRYLTDSNVDWGQGLYQARDYLSRHGIRDCWMAYDGVASPSYYGIPCHLLTANASNPTEVPPLSVNGIFVISALSVSGIEWEPGTLNPYLPFRRAKPVNVIGGAMLVYEGAFDLTGVAAVTHIAHSEAERDTRPKDALADAEAAIQLTPRSVRAHLATGRALVALGRGAEARQELGATVRLAHQAGEEWYPEQLADANRELAKLDTSSHVH
jgi:4-amino-4-deoxy-L-arabinose transferase-like glycosyltransferase